MVLKILILFLSFLRRGYQLQIQHREKMRNGIKAKEQLLKITNIINQRLIFSKAKLLMLIVPHEILTL
jgi:hypothetical protein